jgi:hypothetical protein
MLPLLLLKLLLLTLLLLTPLLLLLTPLLLLLTLLLLLLLNTVKKKKPTAFVEKTAGNGGFFLVTLNVVPFRDLPYAKITQCYRCPFKRVF